MSKLFGLKKWLTLEESAEHLSGVLNEKVTVTDILRLSLDGHLTLSINIVNGATARKGKRISIEDAPIRVMPSIKKWQDCERPKIDDYPGDSDPKAQLDWCMRNKERFSSGELVMFPAGTMYTSFHTYLFENQITTIWGLWDIPMLGSERLDVQHALQQFIDGPEVTSVSLDGTFLVEPDGDTYVQLMEHFSDNEFVKDRDDKEKYPYGEYKSYFPAGGLPSDEKLVIRTGALSAFVRSLVEESESSEKPLGTRERNNLLRVIHALCKQANIDLDNGSGTAQVVAALELAGFDGLNRPGFSGGSNL